MSGPAHAIRALSQAAERHPSKFIEFWCMQHRVDLNALVAAKRSRKRQELCVAVKEKFPKITAVRTGELLGLDHSTVRYAWVTYGGFEARQRRPVTDEERAEILKLAGAGKSYSQISKMIGRDKTTIRAIMDPDYGVKHATYRAAHNANHRQNQLSTKAKAAARLR